MVESNNSLRALGKRLPRIKHPIMIPIPDFIRMEWFGPINEAIAATMPRNALYLINFNSARKYLSMLFLFVINYFSMQYNGLQMMSTGGLKLPSKMEFIFSSLINPMRN